MKLQLYYPTKPYTVTQSFGQNYLPLYKNVLGLAGHNGIDSVAATGTLIRAAHAGTVTFAGEDGSAGYGVVVRTDEEYDYDVDEAYFKSIYWHLKADGIKVRAGQKVKVGDILGLSNNTGMSTGPHLHFGLKAVAKGENDWSWWNIEQSNGYGGAIDPRPYFNGKYAEDEVTKSFTEEMKGYFIIFKKIFKL